MFVCITCAVAEEKPTELKTVGEVKEGSYVQQKSPIGMEESLLLHLPMSENLSALGEYKSKNMFGVKHRKGSNQVGIKGWADFSICRQGIHVPYHDKFDSDEAFTVVMWIKPSSYLDDSGRRASLFAKWWKRPHHGDFIFSFGKRNNSDGYLALTVGNRLHGSQMRSVLVGKSEVLLNEWSQVAAVFSSGKMQLYINGRLDAEMKGQIKHTERARYRHDGVTIGGIPWTNPDNYGFRGEMTDVRFYGRMLKRKEIANLFWERLPSSEPETKGENAIEGRLVSKSTRVRFGAAKDFLNFPKKKQKEIKQWLKVPANEKEIVKILKALKSEDLVTRNSAMEKLWLMGKAVKTNAKKLLESENDPEMRFRLKRILLYDLQDEEVIRDVAWETIARAFLSEAEVGY